MKITLNGYEPKTFLFPDGQPHIDLNPIKDHLGGLVNIRCSIRNPNELMTVCMIIETLRATGITPTLQIGYLMGARMDRRIDAFQPFTLSMVCDMLSKYQNGTIELFNVHSQESIRRLGAKNILPDKQIKLIKTQNPDAMFIAPDKGSDEWIKLILQPSEYVKCTKKRESQTGKLSGFAVTEPDRVTGKRCIIIDDICDGGGTFIGLSKELQKAGAAAIGLYVSHGIFSKGYKLEGISKIWTTNTFKEEYPEHITVLEAF